MNLHSYKKVAFNYLLFVALALFITVTWVEAETINTHQIAKKELQALSRLDYKIIFREISRKIRFEPYSGVMRGTDGVLISGGGNSLEQAMLLAEVLRMKGFMVRIVKGLLKGNNLNTLIEALYPSGTGTTKFSREYAPYNPFNDNSLKERLAEHYWVELYLGKEWLPLDPSFPGAEVGRSYAKAEETFDYIPDTFYQRIKIQDKVKLTNGRIATLGTVDLKVSEIGWLPLSLAIKAIPQLSKDKKGSKKGAGDLFGSAFSSPKKTKKKAPSQKVEGVKYERVLTYGERELHFKSNMIIDRIKETLVDTEWLEFTITVFGKKQVTIKKVLFDHRHSSTPYSFRRLNILIAPGYTSKELVMSEISQARRFLNVKKWKERVKAISKTTRKGKITDQALTEIGDIEGKTGAIIGHVIGMIFAAESDEITDRIAYNNAVSVVRSIPRIIIVKSESQNAPNGKILTRIDLDLRLDRVEAFTFPGYPQKSSNLFYTARGMNESILEGKVLSAVTEGSIPVTTATLLQKAKEDGVDVLLINRKTINTLDRISSLNSFSKELIIQAVNQGYEAVVPEREVQIAGSKRSGWWLYNRQTGEIIGVMDDGGHQAMLQYSVSEKEIGLNDNVGFILGMMIGAVTTHFTIAAKILQYGGITERLIKEVEEFLTKSICTPCKAGASAGSSVSISTTCLKLEKSFNTGASASVSFCEKYQEGFSCAMGLVLKGLKSESYTKVSVESKTEASYTVGCSSGSTN